MEAQTKELVSRVEASPPYKKWKQEHRQGYMSHFFCPINVDCQLKADWEIGFYDPIAERMTVFACTKTITVKENEDEVFKKPDQSVEKLEIDSVKIPFSKVVDVFAQNVEDIFPKAGRGDGFVILQNLEGKTLWNFTFITRALKFINIKIDAASGKIDSHLSMDLVDRGQ